MDTDATPRSSSDHPPGGVLDRRGPAAPDPEQSLNANLARFGWTRGEPVSAAGAKTVRDNLGRSLGQLNVSECWVALHLSLGLDAPPDYEPHVVETARERLAGAR